MRLKNERVPDMKCEKFMCKRDRLTIRGLLYRPEKPIGKIPAVIISHGFMANYNSTKKYGKMFADIGFAALVYDFNGGGLRSHSTGRSTEMSVLTEKEDLKAVIAAVTEMPFVDPDNITLMGCSQGGFVSALTAKELQEKIRRLILLYPALCIPDDARTGHMILAKFDPENVPEKLSCGLMKLGRRYVTDVIDMDPFKEIRDYKGPVMIIHGTRDRIVHPSYSARAYKSYMKVRGRVPSQNCQLVFIDGANHGFYGPFSRAWNKYAAFAIQKFLQGKTLLFNVDVRLTEEQVRETGDGGKIIRWFFKGRSRSGFFRGEVETPAFDEQLVPGGGLFRRKEPDSCCADYELTGKDFRGAPCHVHITNRMLPGGKKDWVLGWKPSVYTDSNALSFVNELKCETYAEGRKKGPYIHIWG